MARGRISLLVDSPLRDLMIASRSVPTEVRRQVNAHVKATVSLIWTGSAGRLSSGTPAKDVSLAAEWGVNPNKIQLVSTYRRGS